MRRTLCVVLPISAMILLIVTYVLCTKQPVRVLQYTDQSFYHIAEAEFVTAQEVNISQSEIDAAILSAYNSQSVKNLSQQMPTKLSFTSASVNKAGKQVIELSVAYTDAVVYVIDGEASVVQNYYSSTYPIVFFEKGVPRGSKELYKQIIDNTGYCITKAEYYSNGVIIMGVKYKL